MIFVNELTMSGLMNRVTLKRCARVLPIVCTIAKVEILCHVVNGEEICIKRIDEMK